MDEETNKVLCQISTANIQEINLLKEWISKQPHLPQQHDDKWLENFLIGCKFSIEKCKKVFDNFYTVRSRLPQYFLSVDPTLPAIKQMGQLYYHMHPSDSPEGYSVAMYGFLETDESRVDTEAIFSRELLIYNWYIKTKSNFTFIVIFDMHGTTMAHVSKAVPYLKEIAFIIQDTLPFRYKQFHVINANPILKTILFLLTPILKEKIKNRIHIHTNDLSTLHKYIPQELLPDEYGGKAGTVKQLNNKLQEEMENIKDDLIEEYKKKTDESKRIKDSTHNELFGVDGSFKSLNID